MHKTVVLNVVGLTPKLIGTVRCPGCTLGEQARLRADRAGVSRRDVHGAVRLPDRPVSRRPRHRRQRVVLARGREVRFWQQSNRLVHGAEDLGRRPAPTRSVVHLREPVLVVQHVLDRGLVGHAAADVSGRRPQDPGHLHAPGRRCATSCRPSSARFRCSSSGDRARRSARRGGSRTRRSASSSKYNPTLTLVYLPHLDYNLQRVGPATRGIAERPSPGRRGLRRLDRVLEARGARVIVLSEYGIVDVSTARAPESRAARAPACSRCATRLGREMLDPGASAAFAVADHQVAHVYVNDPGAAPRVAAHALGACRASTSCSTAPEQAAIGLDHARSGDLVAVAAPDAWFTYYFWLDDARAPDFARTVDIHRKPGYDPVELFVDPAIRVPALTVGWKLAKRKARVPHADGRHSARRDAGQRLAWAADRLGRRGTGADQP